jgi:glycine betaine/proline transport system permease protein
MIVSKEIKNLSRSELIKNFVISNPDYYIDEFKKIGSKPSYSFYLQHYLDQCGLD